jgi:hypothetical protein
MDGTGRVSNWGMGEVGGRDGGSLTLPTVWDMVERVETGMGPQGSKIQGQKRLRPLEWPFGNGLPGMWL